MKLKNKILDDHWFYTLSDQVGTFFTILPDDMYDEGSSLRSCVVEEIDEDN